MSPSDLPELHRIRSVLEQSSRGPLKPKEIARELDLPKQDYRDFKDLLRELEKKGGLYRVKGNRYAVPEKINLVVGRLRVTKKGDAFVRSDRDRTQEVFVPASGHGSAMDGDQVAARIESRPRGRAPVGTVVKVLERGRPTVVGVYHKNESFGFVKPLDNRVFRDVLIPEGMEGEAEDGEVVVVRISQYGDRRLNASGAVDRILGPIEHPGVDVLAILHGHGLPDHFPEEVERAAVEAAERIDEPGQREDRRDLHVLAIDPADAKDHDDALSVMQVGDGLWEVGIHIADVCHFVEEGSALDLEALQRGTSVYLVDQVVPMLPHRLSSDLCSLKEGEDRFALSLFLTLDDDGRLRDHRFERSWIRCRHALDYETVQDVLTGGPGVDPETDEALRALNRLAGELRKKRRERGSLEFDLPEARVVLDEEGVPVDIRKRTQLDSHRLIEDFMILANEVVARECEKSRLPIPYRIHEPPSEDRTEELRKFLASIGHTLPRGKVHPKGLQAILDRTEDRPEASLVSRVILKSMTRARYDPKNVGHFGLASRAYTHFTSPIRRYPDLQLHRVVSRVLVDGESVPDRWTGEGLEEVCTRSSERERLAQQAEWDSVAMKKIEFITQHLGEDFSGTISGVTAFGFFVLLDRFFVEGLVHVRTLGDDYYAFLPESYSLVGERNRRRFRLGDPVKVRVVRANKEEREIDFLLLEQLR